MGGARRVGVRRAGARRGGRRRRRRPQRDRRLAAGQRARDRHGLEHARGSAPRSCCEAIGPALAAATRCRARRSRPADVDPARLPTARGHLRARVAAAAFDVAAPTATGWWSRAGGRDGRRGAVPAAGRRATRRRTSGRAWRCWPARRARAARSARRSSGASARSGTSRLGGTIVVDGELRTYVTRRRAPGGRSAPGTRSTTRAASRRPRRRPIRRRPRSSRPGDGRFRPDDPTGAAPPRDRARSRRHHDGRRARRPGHRPPALGGSG